MTVVLQEVEFAEEPLSPELVLVSPPEIAQLARSRPSRGSWEETVYSAPIEERRRGQSSFLRRNAGLAGFYVFCLASTIGPLAIAVVIEHSA